MATTPLKMIVKDCDEREVLAFDYEFDQAVGNDNQMTGIPRGGLVHVTTKALNTGKADLTAWMLNPTDGREVEFQFVETVSGKAQKTYKFQGSYCIDYTEKWVEGVGHTETLTMTCQNMDFNGVQFQNGWL